MTEFCQNTPERKLWNEGPNYTADAVIIDLDACKVLLIKRRDTGEWALPGGFVESEGESSYEAAIREAREEAGIDLYEDALLIFRGKVDDPRNSASAWIETDAYLFKASAAFEAEAGDDALAGAWHELTQLPPLYGSHLIILEHALRFLDS